MKRLFKLLFILTLAFSAPLSMASGQEKKNEQKIKVIVSDDSGTRTVIDTIFTGDKLPETITLKDGKVIHITKGGMDLSHLESDSKSAKVHVTVSSDLEDGKETMEKVIIMSSDSVKWTVKPGGNKSQVYVYSSSKSTGDKPDKYIVIASPGGKLPEREDEDSDSDVAKYVFAKDGVVVTIESDDEATAKELIKEIESRLDAKADTKKAEKK